jgi:O-antigen/teichoic acid export membrane protein
MVNNRHIFFKTSSYAIASQVISLLVSVCLSLLLPKYLSVEDYGYWQMFILYSSYVGILHFGFNDGVYLKLGGTKFIEINRNEWVSQYIIVFILQVVGALALAYIAYQFIHDTIKQQILYFLAIYVVIENIYKILGFTLMATDGMIFYSKTVIVDKIILFLLLLGVIFRIIPLYPITMIICFLCSHTIAFLILLFRFGAFFRDWHKLSFGSMITNTIATITMGIVLTLSNLLGSFIVGSGRFFVEHFWDIEVFAKISLAVSLSMFLLIFISQIGLVLFPFLRNVGIERQKALLDKSIFLLGIFLLCGYVIFFPLYGFVEYWIPKYKESLIYLVFLLPVSLYETKTALLYTTYMKHLYKQKILCLVNLITVLIAVGCYWIACRMQSIDIILLTMLLSIMFRSIVLQYYLLKYYNLKINFYFYVEIFASALFVISFRYGGIGSLSIVYISLLALVLLYYRKRIIAELASIKEWD